MKNYLSSHFERREKSVIRTKFLLILFPVIFFSSIVNSQICTKEDIKIYNQKISFADENKLCKKPINEVVVEIGKSFLGTEYVAHTLETEGDEQLVINLTGLDCTTFLETTIAMARCINRSKTNFKDFKEELEYVRYRFGTNEGYTSRLHYISDWIYHNEHKCIIYDRSEELGGKKIKFNLNFMSTHPEYYKQLNNKPVLINEIKKQETEINSRNYFYIPKNEIKDVEGKIESGNLIAFVTNEEGLDVAHVGIAIRMENGKLQLLHAPKVGSKVLISEKTLSDYVKSIKKIKGIIVLKVMEPCL